MRIVSKVLWGCALSCLSCSGEEDSSDTTDGVSSASPADTGMRVPTPGADPSTATPQTPTPTPADAPAAVDSGAADNFSFFVTSYQQLIELAGNPDGFGGDLRYNGAAMGLQGADAICQELARRVGFGHRTWQAFLSTSTENAIDRIGSGPWYDFNGTLVANDPSGLTSGDRQVGGCCVEGTYDELGILHDGNSDVNNDGQGDDDHDTMTASNADGTYAGFSCDDWTSTTATPGGAATEEGPRGMMGGGIMMGHSWPARSGENWIESHGGHACAAGTNFIQNGGGDSATVGGGGGYGGFYCFALPQ